MSTTATTRMDHLTATLYLAFELGNGSWKLGFTTGLGQKPRERNVSARDVEAVLREIIHAKRRFGLPDGVRPTSPGEEPYSWSVIASPRRKRAAASWTV